MSASKDVLVILSPVSEPRLRGIAQYAKEHGWHLLVQDRIGQKIEGWRADGVLATVRAGTQIPAQIRKLKAEGIPAVDLTAEVPSLKIDRVTSDHRAIGRLAAEHFEEHHFTNRAWYSNGWSPVHKIRYEGFTENRPAAKWVGKAPVEHAPKPFAVLTYNETDAALLLRKCLALGIAVPEEVSILSIGNDPLLSGMQPVEISSIDQDLERGGYEAAAVLGRLMANSKLSKPSTVLIPPKSIATRQSTDTLGIDNETVRNAVLFIRTNLGRPIGADQVADAVGCTRSQIDKLFAAELGHSIGTEILRQRLSHVKILLKNTDLPASLIAKKAGFCTPSHLNNIFKKMTGVTPRAWRLQ